MKALSVLSLMSIVSLLTRTCVSGYTSHLHYCRHLSVVYLWVILRSTHISPVIQPGDLKFSPLSECLIFSEEY